MRAAKHREPQEIAQGRFLSRGERLVCLLCRLPASRSPAHRYVQACVTCQKPASEFIRPCFPDPPVACTWTLHLAVFDLSVARRALCCLAAAGLQGGLLSSVSSEATAVRRPQVIQMLGGMLAKGREASSSQLGQGRSRRRGRLARCSSARPGFPSSAQLREPSSTAIWSLRFRCRRGSSCAGLGREVPLSKSGASFYAFCAPAPAVPCPS